MVLCQALFQSITEDGWTGMHEKLNVTRKLGVSKAWQRVAGPVQVAWRKTSTGPFFSAKVEQVHAFCT